MGESALDVAFEEYELSVVQYLVSECQSHSSMNSKVSELVHNHSIVANFAAYPVFASLGYDGSALELMKTDTQFLLSVPMYPVIL